MPKLVFRLLCIQLFFALALSAEPIWANSEAQQAATADCLEDPSFAIVKSDEGKLWKVAYLKYVEDGGKRVAFVDCSFVVPPIEATEKDLIEETEAGVSVCEGCELEPSSPYEDLALMSQALSAPAGAQCKSGDSAAKASLDCGKEMACNIGRSLLAPIKGLPYLWGRLQKERKNNKSCLSASQSDCVTDVVRGILESVWQAVKGVGWLLKEGALATWRGVKWVGGSVKSWFSSEDVAAVESKAADAALFASQTSDSFLHQFKRNPFSALKSMGVAILSSITDSLKETFGCAKWEGLPYGSKCLEKAGRWDCLSCSQKMSMACGAFGFVGGELVTAFLTGGALNIASKISKVKSIHKLMKVVEASASAAKKASDVSGLSAKAAIVAGGSKKLAKSIVKLIPKKSLRLSKKIFDRLYRSSGLKFFVKLNEDVFMAGLQGRLPKATGLVGSSKGVKKASSGKSGGPPVEVNVNAPEPVVIAGKNSQQGGDSAGTYLPISDLSPVDPSSLQTTSAVSEVPKVLQPTTIRVRGKKVKPKKSESLSPQDLGLSEASKISSRDRQLLEAAMPDVADTRNLHIFESSNNLLYGQPQRYELTLAQQSGLGIDEVMAITRNFMEELPDTGGKLSRPPIDGALGLFDLSGEVVVDGSMNALASYKYIAGRLKDSVGALKVEDIVETRRLSRETLRANRGEDLVSPPLRYKEGGARVKEDIHPEVIKRFEHYGIKVEKRDDYTQIQFAHESNPPPLDRYVERLNTMMKADYPPEVVATHAIQDLLIMHPFADGNGRTARIIGQAVYKKMTGKSVVFPKSFHRELQHSAQDLAKQIPTSTSSWVQGAPNPMIGYNDFVRAHVLESGGPVDIPKVKPPNPKVVDKPFEDFKISGEPVSYSELPEAIRRYDGNVYYGRRVKSLVQARRHAEIMFTQGRSSRGGVPHRDVKKHVYSTEKKHGPSGFFPTTADFQSSLLFAENSRDVGGYGIVYRIDAREAEVLDIEGLSKTALAKETNVYWHTEREVVFDTNLDPSRFIDAVIVQRKPPTEDGLERVIDPVGVIANPNYRPR